MKSKELESDLQDDIKAFLRKNRIYHFRFQAQSNLNGLPDIICLYNGLFLGLELKRPKQGKPTELQLRKLEAINDNGGIGVIVESVEQVEWLLKRIDKYDYDIFAEGFYTELGYIRRDYEQEWK